MANCPKCEAQVQPDDQFCPECGFELKEKVIDFSEMRTFDGDDAAAETMARNQAAVEILEPGTVFADRYEIDSVIGRGGMGVVYKAADTLTKQTVALKLIRPERLSGTNAIEKLIAEGVTARDIRHSNIVAVYDVGQSDGQPFVSMEYLEGKSLRTWHREMVQQSQDVPLRVAARIMAEIMDGLKAAHAAGVIHRDLKPENIVLMSDPTEESAPLKILDFGIARATGAALESGTGTGLGTPRYMAPEQITNADSAGPPADIYSSSVIFYELLVGVLPQGHWQPPSGGRSDVPLGIDELIEKGLSNRPGNRAQSAADYRKALVDAVNISKPASAVSFNWDPKYTKWGGIAAAVVVGLLLVDAIIPDEDEIYLPTEESNPCAGLSGVDYRLCMGLEIEDPVEPPDNPPVGPGALPPVQPERTGFSSLSGQWILDYGAVSNVTVSQSGSFSGTGMTADGFRTTIRGQFSGVNATYTITAPDVGLSVNGRMVWDRLCHLDYQTFDITGSYIAESGRIHVNHQPGAPCPS